MHLFDPFLDHDYYFKLLLLIRRSRTPNQLLDALLHTIAISGLSCVRTELPHLLVIPSLAPHPVHPDGESAGHRDLGDLPSPTHRQVKRLAAWLLKNSICLKTDPKGVTRNVSEIGENRL
jgi:hypothetical protein